EGLSLIIVEQDIVQALKAASHVYCLQEGRVALEGAASGLTREAISAAYFGGGGGDRVSKVLCRHARPCAGHPRLFSLVAEGRTWMAGASPAMTAERAERFM